MTPSKKLVADFLAARDLRDRRRSELTEAEERFKAAQKALYEALEQKSRAASLSEGRSDRDPDPKQEVSHALEKVSMPEQRKLPGFAKLPDFIREVATLIRKGSGTWDADRYAKETGLSPQNARARLSRTFGRGLIRRVSFGRYTAVDETDKEEEKVESA